MSLDKIDSLEALLRRVERLEDIEEIRKLMGRRAYLHSSGDNKKELELYWSRRDDTTFEPEEFGIFEGADHIWEAYGNGNPFPPGTPGLLIEHTLTTDVIEVAADGQTAKGVWMSPGHETFPVGDVRAPHWSWGRYAVDFIKEDGQWKIWHLHVITTFRTPFDQDWVDSAVNKRELLIELGGDGEARKEGIPADRPVSFNQPYHPDVVQVLHPVPPTPYGTWDETWSATELHLE